jgi:hypothetical protein
MDKKDGLPWTVEPLRVLARGFGCAVQVEEGATREQLLQSHRLRFTLVTVDGRARTYDIETPDPASALAACGSFGPISCQKSTPARTLLEAVDGRAASALLCHAKKWTRHPGLRKPAGTVERGQVKPEVPDGPPTAAKRSWRLFP